MTGALGPPPIHDEGNVFRADDQFVVRGLPAGSPIADWAEAEAEVRWLQELARVQMMARISRPRLERADPETELSSQEEKHRIARQIQQAVLPMPTLAGLTIGGRCVSAVDVGGDCYDFIPLPVEGRERLGVLIGDASGHGMGAAVRMAETRAYLHALSLAIQDVGLLLNLTNKLLANALMGDQFVTAFLMALDPGARTLHYASAGHWPAYILDRQGEIRAVLSSTGLPLGIDSESEFSVSSPVSLESGDLIVLFTDGLVEAASSDRKPFGVEPTLGVVRAHQHQTPDEILEALFDAVVAHSERRVDDDITALIIKAG